MSHFKAKMHFPSCIYGPCSNGTGREGDGEEGRTEEGRRGKERDVEFPHIRPQILLERLQISFGLDDIVLRWIRCYLS